MSKYGSRKKTCRQNHEHDSEYESDYCDTLEILRLAGEINGYKIQVRFPLIVNCIKIADHYVDFLVEPKFGAYMEVHEAKGFNTAVWKIKKKLFQACYPHIQYHVVQKRMIKREKRKRRINPCLEKILNQKRKKG